MRAPWLGPKPVVIAKLFVPGEYQDAGRKIMHKFASHKLLTLGFLLQS
jgi:hypothetical protein